MPIDGAIDRPSKTKDQRKLETKDDRQVERISGGVFTSSYKESRFWNISARISPKNPSRESLKESPIDNCHLSAINATNNSNIRFQHFPIETDT